MTQRRKKFLIELYIFELYDGATVKAAAPFLLCALAMVPSDEVNEEQ